MAATAAQLDSPTSAEAAREARLAALVDAWTAHMAWRGDFAAWRERRLWQERYQDERLRQIADFCGPLAGKRILDLGCGMGGLTVALRRVGADAVGHEPNRAYGAICQLRAARYGLPLPIVAATGEALPFAAGSFDIVVCLDVLEHAERLDGTLAEIARVLRPGGHAIVTATNRFAFRDPHYHLRGINWLPRPLAEAIIRRRGRGKDRAAFADRQALAAMHYVTYPGFVARCRALGFAVEDTRERRVRTPPADARTRFARPLALLRRLGLAVPAYRLYRALFLGTFEVHLTRLRITNGRPGERANGRGDRSVSNPQSAIRNPQLNVALYNVTTTTRLGGVETFVWELARQLGAAGLAVEVIGGGGGGGPAGVPGPGVRVRRAPFVRREWLRRLPLLGRQYGPTKLAERLSFGLTALPLLLRGNYDILHIQKPFDLPVGALVRWLTGGRTRLVFGCHGRDFFAGDRRWTGAVDVAVSCSATNAAEVSERYGLTPRVVYNGIDTDRFVLRPDDDPATRRLRERLTGGVERPVLLQVGRLVRWKGAEYAIGALAQLRADPAPVLALAGTGPYRAELARLARDLGVADRVVFLGAWPHAAMPDLYPAADLVLGTSFVNETFGISLCEALACGRAVVASDFGGFREVVRHGETGLLVPPQDAAALAAAIDALLADPARRRALAAAGRQDVIARFSWPAVVARVLAAYDAALSDE